MPTANYEHSSEFLNVDGKQKLKLVLREKLITKVTGFALNCVHWTMCAWILISVAMYVLAYNPVFRFSFSYHKYKGLQFYL